MPALTDLAPQVDRPTGAYRLWRYAAWCGEVTLPHDSVQVVENSPYDIRVFNAAVRRLGQDPYGTAAVPTDRNVDPNAERPKTRIKRWAQVGTPSPWRRAAWPVSCPHPRDKRFGAAVLVRPALPELARHYSADGRPVRTPRETE